MTVNTIIVAYCYVLSRCSLVRLIKTKGWHNPASFDSMVVPPESKSDATANFSCDNKTSAIWESSLRELPQIHRHKHDFSFDAAFNYRRYSSVCIVTDWITDGLGFNSCRRQTFFPSPQRPNGLWGAPSLQSNVQLEPHPRCNTARTRRQESNNMSSWRVA